MSLILLIGLLAFTASDGSAQRLVGLFDLEMGVRAAAMGSAYVAVDDGNLGIFYNPAGLGTLRELHANAFFESRFSRASQGVFSLAVPNFAAQLAFHMSNEDSGPALHPPQPNWQSSLQALHARKSHLH